MKKIAIIMFAFILLPILSAHSIERYGAGIKRDAPAVKVRDVMYNPAMNGRVVNLEGTVAMQCGNGCWFLLYDDTGLVFINLQVNNFKIPPARGKRVKVTGLVQRNNQIVQIVASGVEVR